MATTNVNWKSLPAPLAERIMRQAFHTSSSALTQWLSMSLVSKCDLILPLLGARY